MKYKIYSNGTAFKIPGQILNSYGEIIVTPRSEEVAIKLDDGDTLYLTIDNDLDETGCNCIYFHLESGECCNLFYISPANAAFSQASSSGWVSTDVIDIEYGDIIRVYKYDSEWYDADQECMNDEAKLIAYGATCVLMLKLEDEETDSKIKWRRIHPSSTQCAGQTINLPTLEDKITINSLGVTHHEVGFYFTLESGAATCAYCFSEGVSAGHWQQTGYNWIGFTPYEGTELHVYHLSYEDIYEFIAGSGMGGDYEWVLQNPTEFKSFFNEEAIPTILRYQNGKWVLIQEGNKYGEDWF